MPLVRNQGCADLRQLLRDAVEPNNNNAYLVDQHSQTRAVSNSFHHFGNQGAYTGMTITDETIKRARARDLAENLAKKLTTEATDKKAAINKTAAKKNNGN